MAKAYENYQPPYDDINELNVKNTLERDIAYTKDEIVEIDERIARLEVRQREAVANDYTEPAQQLRELGYTARGWIS